MQRAESGLRGKHGEGLISRAIFINVLYVCVSMYMCARI
jgi:hypothetical protein